jgi:hypothetical protein
VFSAVACPATSCKRVSSLRQVPAAIRVRRV